MANVVFVIGAGASTDFGTSFPLGSELAKEIEQQLQADLAAREGPIINAVSMNGGYGAPHAQAFGRINQGLASRDSIDQFIDDLRTQPCPWYPSSR